MNIKEKKYQELCKKCRVIRKAAEENEKDWLLDVQAYVRYSSRFADKTLISR